MRFFVTFGQLHPLRDGYVIVMASNYDNAREITFKILGTQWSALNPLEKASDTQLYPMGPIGHPIIGE